MKTKATWWVLAAQCIIVLQARAAWIDASVGDLLPPTVGKPLEKTLQFPLFRWNFVVLQSETAPEWNQLDAFCTSLTEREGELLGKSACGTDLHSYRALLTDWSRDQFLRAPPSSSQDIHAALNAALAKASLPLEPELLEILRADPLESYREFIGKALSYEPLLLPREHGYFFEAATNRVIIPVQLAFAPSQTASTGEFMRRLPRPESSWRLLGIVGPHASALENERQVYADIDRVSTIGIALLAVLIAACGILGRWRLILLAPPVLVSTAVSAVATYLLFGRIHGLTLAFGPGIVGLVLDHGLHSCFNMRWKGAWRANFYGLITTLAGLVFFLFSSVPFLRQLMAFSIIGLSIGFMLYRWLHRRYPSVFEVKPLFIEPKPSAWKFALAALMMAGIVVAGARLHPDYSMRTMNFQSAESAALTKWLLGNLKAATPIVQIWNSEDPIVTAASRMTSLQIPAQSIAQFLPTPPVQEKNLLAWQSLLCARSDWTVAERKFFEPFFSLIDCRDLTVQTLKHSVSVPSYLKDFTYGGDWATLWFPENPGQRSKLADKFPEAKSLSELVEEFPRILSNEIAWMAPLAILISILLLWHYYRNWSHVAMAMIPFFSGIGLYGWMAVLNSYTFSFVSLIALVMVFGLSLDYGIFAVNLYTGRLGPSTPGVWTSVILAALVTAVGFGPLIICRHPVLAHLGQVLFWGTTGTVLGCLWGIPGAYGIRMRRRAA